MGRWLALLAGALGVWELVLLYRIRHRLLDPRRYRLLVQYMQGGQADAAALLNSRSQSREGTHPRALGPSQQPADVPHDQLQQRHRAAAAFPTGAARQEGVVYVDPQGRCTFADQRARQLLGWRCGALALADVLSGGGRESAAFLALLAEQGQIQHYPVALSGEAAARVEFSAVALRDRDDNFWGAALFVRHVTGAARGAQPGAAQRV